MRSPLRTGSRRYFLAGDSTVQLIDLMFDPAAVAVAVVRDL